MSIHFDLGKFVTAIAIAFLAIISLQKADAHHGFDGRYDSSRPLYLEGTVTAATWQSPHSVIAIALPGQVAIPENLGALKELENLEGSETLKNLTVPQNLLGQTQQLELPPVGSMVNPIRERLQVGDRIGAIVYRNCDSPHQLRVQLARFSDGSAVARPGTVQTEVNGCNR